MMVCATLQLPHVFVRAVKPALEDGDLRIFWLSPATGQNPNRSLYVFLGVYK
jgi:hypothetical protein